MSPVVLNPPNRPPIAPLRLVIGRKPLIVGEQQLSAPQRLDLVKPRQLSKDIPAELNGIHAVGSRLRGRAFVGGQCLRVLSHGSGREAGQEPMMVNATVHGMVCVAGIGQRGVEDSTLFPLDLKRNSRLEGPQVAEGAQR